MAFALDLTVRTLAGYLTLATRRASSDLLANQKSRERVRLIFASTVKIFLQTSEAVVEAALFFRKQSSK